MTRHEIKSDGSLHLPSGPIETDPIDDRAPLQGLQHDTKGSPGAG